MQALGSSDKKRASYAPSSKSPSVSLTRSGLPRVIPAHHRRVISQGGKRSELVVRCYLTIFSLYRVIDVKGKIDLSNIEKPAAVPLGRMIFSSPKLQAVLQEMEPEKILSLVEQVIPDIRQTPVRLRFADKISWSVGPNSQKGEA